MASHTNLPPARHIPYKKGGWGAAILTLAAAAGAFLTAWYIHERTYRHPRDVMMREVYEQPTQGNHPTSGTPAASHGGQAHQTPAAPAAPKH